MRAQWAQAATLSAALHPPEVKAPAPLPPRQGDDASDLWARRREEATSLAPGYFGYLLWVERRCVDGGLHAMDPLWLDHFAAFYESGKFVDLGRFGLRAAKSDSTCRAIVAESLLIQRHLEPTVAGVCPIISSTMKEAGDRFTTIKEILRACGLEDRTGTRTKEDERSFRTTGGGNQDLVVSLYDSQGHAIEFRIYPARDGSIAGFTGIAGFGDELDLWGKPGAANPANKAVEILLTRYATQPGARLHLMSATYDRASHHATMIAKGDTPLQRVARLGVKGAAKDTAARAALAKAIGSADPLLLTPADPMSTDIGSWNTNPIVPIERCYQLSDGDLRRMFSLFGARPEFAGKNGGVGAIEQLRGVARRNAELNAGASPRWQGLPSYDPRAPRTSRGRAL